MTEEEWLASNNPRAMLGYLLGDPFLATDGEFGGAVVARWGEPPSDRKLHLFIAACLRAAWGWLSPRYSSDILDRFEAAIEAGERLEWRGSYHGYGTVGEILARHKPASSQVYYMLDRIGIAPIPWANLLREIVGNPFWTPMRVGRDWSEFAHHDRHLLVYERWLTPQVLDLAQAAYDHRLDDGTLDPHRLAVLADAMEEAGCTDEALLSHLRSPGHEVKHVRGCWALDLVLGKE